MTANAVSPLWIILTILAVYRIAYLIAMETGPFGAAERLRGWVLRQWPPRKQGNILIESWQWEGINCPLCVSFWLALPATAGVFINHWIISMVIVWLGIAGAVLLIHKGLKIT